MIGIHQSQFIPWVPYFFKILLSDVFVVLDHVQYQKNGLQNRNQIKTPQGAQWITLPVKTKMGTSINEVKLANKQRDISKILKTVGQNYQGSLFFQETHKIWDNAKNCQTDNLFDINNKVFYEILQLLDYKGSIVLSSSLKTDTNKDDLIIDIIKTIGENSYVSGKGALNYMNLNKFKDNNISVYVFDFTYREYPQLWGRKNGFISELSIIDLFYNYLEKAKSYILENGHITKVV